MRNLPTSLVLCGCLLSIGVGCAKSDGSGTGGSSATGGSGATGGNGPGTGGSSSTGGNGPGTGGNGTGTGGNVATGGVTGTGGNGTGGNGTGGKAGGSGTGTGGTATGGSTGTGGTTTSCTITPTATKSTKIGTVGIVTFTTSATSPTEAHIDFGLDTNYGMTAPVTLSSTTSNRTLLLGMKASKTYHYRISLTSSSGTCVGGDNTFATGALPNGSALPMLTITPTTKPAGLWGGFLVIGSYQGATNQSFILDADGDFVWWYADGADGCGTRMSYDGQYMWINNGNVPATSGSTHVHRVTMDGMTDTDLSTPFANMSHQVTPLPDGSVAFYASGSNGCDDIKIFPANGTASSTPTTVVNARTAHGGTGACHVNNIEYSQADDTLVFSDLDNDCLTKVSKTTGATVWVLNGNTGGITSTFTGDLWSGGEHGFHLLSLTDVLLFNNNDQGSSSQALELTLDTSAKKSTKKWSYTPSTATKVMVLGDVQRMTTAGPSGAGNGNTIVDFGTGNKVHEVDASGTMLQEIKSQYPFGFMEKRATLYGPPTRQ